MSGVESAARIRRDWIVEWEEPDVEPSRDPTSDADLQDVVRRHVANRVPSEATVTPPSSEPVDASDTWMVGEPLS